MVDVTPEQAATIVLAYEPVWAIGTGRVATPADAQEVCGGAAGRAGREVRRGDRRRRPDPVRRFGQVGQRRGDHRADRTSTARWSAGPSLDGTEFANLAANAVGVLP